MSRRKPYVPTERYVIECRAPDGSLDLTGPQPENVFGLAAITGISEDAMARVLFSRCGDGIVLDGGNICGWPSKIDPRRKARRRTW